MGGIKLYEAVDKVAAWGQELIGASGWQRGRGGGATYPAEAESLRKRLPHTFFLVPGYGAQGLARAILQ